MSREILIVEDDEAGMEVLEELFTYEGYSVLRATSCDEGFDLFLKARPSIVISDFLMPTGNGSQLFVRIRAIDPQVAFVLISALNTWRKVDWLDEPDAFFAKPFDFKTLLAFVKKIHTEDLARWKRKYPRWSCRVQSQVEGSHWLQPLDISILNISMGGMFFQSNLHELPAIGDAIKFFIPIQEGINLSFSGEAVCWWSDHGSDSFHFRPAGFGVGFKEFKTPMARNAIEGLIEGAKINVLT